MGKARKAKDLFKLDLAEVEETAVLRGVKKALKNQKEKVGLVIAVNTDGRKSIGIILNKTEMKTYAFYFDGTKEAFKAGNKVRYKLNKKPA